MHYERLKSIRNNTGMSQDEASVRLGINRTSLSKIENGFYDLSFEMALRMEELYQVDIHDFVTKKPELYDQRFRSKIDSIDEKVMNEIKEFFESFHAVDSLLPDTVDISRAAHYFRNLLGLTPFIAVDVYSLINLLEEKNIFVILKPIENSEFSGAFFKLYDYDIILVNSRHNYARILFTIAHELAHKVLENIPHDEKDADKFAASFLMPDDAFNFILNKKSDFNEFDVLKCADYFKTSYASVIKKIEDLYGKNSIISNDIRKVAFKDISVIGNKDLSIRVSNDDYPRSQFPVVKFINKLNFLLKNGVINQKEYDEYFKKFDKKGSNDYEKKY